jgi:hypothetical protein
VAGAAERLRSEEQPKDQRGTNSFSRTFVCATVCRSLTKSLGMMKSAKPAVPVAAGHVPFLPLPSPPPIVAAGHLLCHSISALPLLAQPRGPGMKSVVQRRRRRPNSMARLAMASASNVSRGDRPSGRTATGRRPPMRRQQMDAGTHLKLKKGKKHICAEWGRRKREKCQTTTKSELPAHKGMWNGRGK